MNIYEIFSGDTPTLKFTVTNSDGSACDLTNATVTFVGALYPDAAELAWSATGTITNAAGGLCEYTMTADDTGVPGMYDCELHIEWVSGVILTADRFRIRILRSMYVAPAP